MSNQCPCCGRIVKPEYALSTKLRKAIEKRLTEYGYVPGMNPDKNTAYIKVRGVLMIRIGKHPLHGKRPYEGKRATMIETEDELDSALWHLDAILPPKEKL